ncbi:MAG TPA: invasion associated locus B family protein [Xanthobacteraceae bacterium]|nr:invasion associated locus B family protein [Xanthobacteraceae bacterium]
MKFRTAIVPALMAGFAVVAAASLGTDAVAQTKDKAAPKAAPAPKGAPSAPAAKGEQPGIQQQVAVPSPWTKFCERDPNANKQVCLVAQDIRAETGQFLASVAVREVEGEPKKTFIIAVPPGMQLQPGMRVVVDRNEPLPARYSICFQNACYGDMDIDAKFIDVMKKGQALTIQAINQMGRTVNYTLVLKDFAKAYDGPAVDPKEIQAQQQKLKEGMQKQADEVLKKLESQKK